MRRIDPIALGFTLASGLLFGFATSVAADTPKPTMVSASKAPPVSLGLIKMVVCAAGDIGNRKV